MLPSGQNLSDAEIAYFLDEESDSVTAAAARACEALSQAAAAWAARAVELRGVMAGYVTMGLCDGG